MQDRSPRHKNVPDEASREPLPELSGGRQVRIELKGPLGCMAAILLLAIAFAILVAAAFAGLIAVALAFWIGLGFVALAIIAALIRGRL